ncbi:MAG: hypothetical protein IKV53_01840 [Clostridia bacterium]|nr:hypothetical protein [Clostridia bacterium]
MGVKLCGRWEAVGFPTFAYNFLEDGTGYYSMSYAKKEFTFSATEERVTLCYPGDAFPLCFRYEINEDILSIEDSLGNFVEYKKCKAVDDK